VDVERSEKYPTNFVCILPKNIKPKNGYHTKFEREFKDKSAKLAKKLLNRSLKVEEDWEVREEIKERLDLLKTKPEGYKRKTRLFFQGYHNLQYQ
jgi:hypothetical protein